MLEVAALQDVCGGELHRESGTSLREKQRGKGSVKKQRERGTFAVGTKPRWVTDYAMQREPECGVY